MRLEVKMIRLKLVITMKMIRKKEKVKFVPKRIKKIKIAHKKVRKRKSKSKKTKIQLKKYKLNMIFMGGEEDIMVNWE